MRRTHWCWFYGDRLRFGKVIPEKLIFRKNDKFVKISKCREKTKNCVYLPQISEFEANSRDSKVTLDGGLESGVTLPIPTLDLWLELNSVQNLKNVRHFEKYTLCMRLMDVVG